MHPVSLSLMLTLGGGCVAEADTPGRLSPLYGEAALIPAQALLVPCQTPSGTTAALAVIRSDAGCTTAPTSGEGTRPRDCAVWQKLLEHPFACQPGAPLRRPDAQEAVLFWLSGAETPRDLSGATASRITRWRCGEDAPRSLHGDVLVLQDDPSGATVIDLQVEDLEGTLAFTVCR